MVDFTSNNSVENVSPSNSFGAGSGSAGGALGNSGGALSAGQDEKKVSSSSGTARFDKHEKSTRWAHRLLWFAIILLLLLIGRSFFESIMLRQSNNDLRGAVEAQTLAISQAGSVPPNLGAGLAPPGTTLRGPDGQTYICPAGPAGAAGSSGADGTVGLTGPAGGPGFSVTAGQGLSDVDGSVNVVLDINSGSGLDISSDTLNVLGADGTILVTSSGVKVGLINDTNLNSGFGAGQVSAADILLQDLGGYYVSGNVEDALQEAGPVVSAGLQNLDEAYNNYGAVVGPTITVDGAEGQSGNLIFDLTTTQDLAIQDAGVNFAIFDDSGNVTFFNDFGVGASAGAETLSNVGFLPNGDDAYIAGSLGVESDIYSDSGLTVGSLSEAPTTTYGKGSISSAGALALSSGAASDITITSAGDITLAPTGADVLVSDLLTVTTASGLDDPSLRLVNSATPETVDLITGPSDPAAASVVASAGSLYLRDTAGADGGQLWLKEADAAAGWVQIADVTSTTLDSAYNNFGAAAPTITLDTAEGQAGPLTFELASNDFVIKKGSTFGATFSATSGDLKIFSGGSSYTGPAPTTTASISQESAAGLALVLYGKGSGGTLQVTDANTAAAHFGAAINYANGTVTTGSSAALQVYSTNTGLGGGGGIVQIDTDATSIVPGAYNLIEMRSSPGGSFNTRFKVDNVGTVYGDGGVYTTPADYAEFFSTKDKDLAPGELVSLDLTQKDAVKRAHVGESAIGVISTKPAVVGNDKLGLPREQHPKTDALVGLLGQLPVLVDDSGGPISIGDYITVSDKSGYGRKAKPGEPVVGVALSGTGADGKANVLIAPGVGSLAPLAGTAITAATAASTTDASSVTATTSSQTPASSESEIKPTIKGSDIALNDTQTYKDLTVLNQIAADKIQVLKDLEVRGQITAGSLIVDGEATFGDAVKIQGHLLAGRDTAGRLTIKAGDKSARVDFDKDYDATPFVQITPLDFSPPYRLEKITDRGFIVSLSEPLNYDLEFNWLAVGQLK